MDIIIDKVICVHTGAVLGYVVFDDDPTREIDHPTQHDVKISPAEMVGILHRDADLRERGGWHIAARHDGETDDTTRWARLVKHIESTKGSDALKSAITAEDQALAE